VIILGEGAEENGFASMLAELLRQNIEAKPQKKRDIASMSGSAAIVADDADIAVTLFFDNLCVVVRSGIVGVPDVTIRGMSETIMELSNIPINFGLPMPAWKNADETAAAKSAYAAMRAGKIHTYGMFRNPGLVLKLTRLMSVNG
jgi:hypothetical protein